MVQMEQNHWNESSVLQKYKKYRTLDERFASEKYFLENLDVVDGLKVLDIGSACGDLAYVLASIKKDYNFSYTGIEPSPLLYNESINRLKVDTFVDILSLKERFAPKFLNQSFDQKFLESHQDEFDFIIATGFIQHSLKPYQSIIDFFKCSSAKSSLLFDVKLVKDFPSLCDISLAFCDHTPPLPFNVFNYFEFIDFLGKSLPPCSIQMYGYFTSTHSSVSLPRDFDEQICSAHVLLSFDSFDDIFVDNQILPFDVS